MNNLPFSRKIFRLWFSLEIYDARNVWVGSKLKYYTQDNFQHPKLNFLKYGPSLCDIISLFWDEKILPSPKIL